MLAYRMCQNRNGAAAKGSPFGKAQESRNPKQTQAQRRTELSSRQCVTLRIIWPHYTEWKKLARRRLRPARRIRQFDRDGCRTAGFSRLARILERQDQREVNGETPE